MTTIDYFEIREALDVAVAAGHYKTLRATFTGETVYVVRCKDVGDGWRGFDSDDGELRFYPAGMWELLA